MTIERKQNSTISAKDKLLTAAMNTIRAKGYCATTVEELCNIAGVTKGSFFHYFASKEDLAIQAAKHWSEVTSEFFHNAPYHDHHDPLDRFLAYIEFRKDILVGNIPEFTCLVGTMVQETYDTHHSIRKACCDSIFSHAKTLEQDISDAMKLYPPKIKTTAASLAIHTQAVIQGAFILAKASDSLEHAANSIDHLKGYIKILFNKPVN